MRLFPTTFTDVRSGCATENLQPVLTFHAWQVLIGLLEMRHEISGLLGGPKDPSDVARGHCQGMDQYPRTMADVLMFTPFAPVWLGRFGGGFALEHLQAGLFVAANHQAVLLIRLARLGVKLVNHVGLGIKVLVMAIQSVVISMLCCAHDSMLLVTRASNHDIGGQR